MNRENVEKLIEALEKDTFQDRGVGFNMGVFMMVHNGINKVADFRDEPCRTVACIAGHAYLLKSIEEEAPGTWEQITGYGHRCGFAVSRQAQIWLDLDGWTAEELFNPSFRPIDRIGPDMAVKVLRNLLETGEVDWRVAGFEAAGEVV